MHGKYFISCTVLSQSIICLSKLQPWKRARFQSLFVITKGALRLFIFRRSQLVLMLDKLHLVKLKLIRNNRYPFYSLPFPMKRRISCFYSVFFSPIGQRLGPDWSVQMGGLVCKLIFPTDPFLILINVVFTFGQWKKINVQCRKQMLIC